MDQQCKPIYPNISASCSALLMQLKKHQINQDGKRLGQPVDTDTHDIYYSSPAKSSPCSCPAFGCRFPIPPRARLCSERAEELMGIKITEGKSVSFQQDPSSDLLCYLGGTLAFARIVKGRNKQLREQIGLLFFFLTSALA